MGVTRKIRWMATRITKAVLTVVSVTLQTGITMTSVLPWSTRIPSVVVLYTGLGIVNISQYLIGYVEIVE